VGDFVDVGTGVRVEVEDGKAVNTGVGVSADGA
jgi:hypothetical protein